MKKIVLPLILFYTTLIFSQNDPINRFVTPSLYIEHKGNIKILNIKQTRFSYSKEKIDTSYNISKYEFSKTGLLLKRSNTHPFNDISQQINYNNNKKIISIYRKNENTENKLKIFAQQFFNKNSEYPDSLYIYYSNSNKESEKYINYFSNNLLIKQEFYTQDTLRNYETYNYDSQNRIIKENFYNTENGFGITIGKGIPGFKDGKTLYPNDSTLYSYKTNNDTLITIKRKKYPSMEIIKKHTSKDYSLIITEQYNNNYLTKNTNKYTNTKKDSISEIEYNFNEKKEIHSFIKTFTTPKKITNNWKFSNYYGGKEKSEIVNITIKYDSHNNWIKKTYSANNNNNLKDGVYLIVEREIEYY